MSTNDSINNDLHGHTVSLDTSTDNGETTNTSTQNEQQPADTSTVILNNSRIAHELDGRLAPHPPFSCGAIMDVTLTEMSDDKKRPLSVSSVTSSVSSSSSLPRHQRKKLATCQLMTSHASHQMATSQHLNNVSIEEDQSIPNSEGLFDNSMVDNCDEFQNYLNQNRINLKEIPHDGSLESAKDSGSLASGESASISRDISGENFSENSDISDMSALSSVSGAAVAQNDVTKTDTDLNDPASDHNGIPRKRGSTVKPYTPLCDPHGRAPRTTLPSVTSTQDTLLEAARAWSSHTYKVIQEIVSTERVYVRDLQDIVQVRFEISIKCAGYIYVCHYRFGNVSMTKLHVILVCIYFVFWCHRTSTYFKALKLIIYFFAHFL